jgi:hypothetical protein
MNIITQVKSLELPEGQHIVVGSGIMSAYGIREHKDIDLLVTHSLYEKLKALGWKVETMNGIFEFVSNGIFGASPEIITLPNYKPNLEELLKNAEIINDIPFMSLNDLMDFKKALGREKDLKDIELVQKYLAERRSK